MGRTAEVLATSDLIEENRSKFLLPLDEWTLEDAAWRELGRTLLATGTPGQHMLSSPAITLQAGTTCVIGLDWEPNENSFVRFGLFDLDKEEWLSVREECGSHAATIVLWYRPSHSIRSKLFITDARQSINKANLISGLALTFRPARPQDPVVQLSDVIPPPNRWQNYIGIWNGDRNVLEWPKDAQPGVLIKSQEFFVEKDWTYTFILSFEHLSDCVIEYDIYDIAAKKSLVTRRHGGMGPTVSIIQYHATRQKVVRLNIRFLRYPEMAFGRLSDVSIEIYQRAANKNRSTDSSNPTALAHWGRLRRFIHKRCKVSPILNALVASIEMRLKREEVMSLPQYMALCPTGQCNALCDFCSVTTNRTGIIKRQLSDESLDRFLNPVTNTVWMYGLEGNGEPTLFRGFLGLLDRLIGSGAKIYLITNGSRLTREIVIRLLSSGVDSVNFSLNAATAETHRRVMKLKNFDEITEHVRMLVRSRGDGLNPQISVSFVVERKNVHEVPDFLRFVCQELKVDKAFIRPLSEIGTEIGTVEDMRDLPPFDSDILDMLEGVEEFYDDLEAGTMPTGTEIVLTPENFRAVRPDPVDRILMPLGYGDRLLARRRRDWMYQSHVQTAWTGSRLHIETDKEFTGGDIAICPPVPVEPGHDLIFQARGWCADGTIVIAITDIEDRTVCSHTFQPGPEDKFQPIEFSFATGEHEELGIVVRSPGGGVRAEIDFERLRRPASRPHRVPKLPPPSRWEIDAPNVEAEWRDSRLHIRRPANPIGAYILKSYGVPCMPDTEISFPMKIDLRSGAFAVSVLREDASGFIVTQVFDTPGICDVPLSFNTGESRFFRVVLQSAPNREGGRDALDVTVDWGDAVGAKATLTLAANPAPPISPSLAASSVGADAAMSRFWAYALTSPHRALWTLIWAKGISTLLPRRSIAGIGRMLRRIRPESLYGKPRYYCQKPWTDIANFTVDGRVDICCIATGASQERFALGNLMTQDFQEIWNGEQAREFRRTVNSKQPLPPCQRCPMAYAYQGPLFDPQFTGDSIRDMLIGTRLLGPIFGAPPRPGLASDLHTATKYALYFPIFLIINFIWFRHFKR